MNIEEDLNEKLEEIKKTKTNVIKDGDSFEVKYHGINIPIKNEKLKASFNKINEVTQKIEEEDDLTKKINMYTDVFNILDEIAKLIKKEKSEESNQNADSKYILILNRLQ
jgi:hypothetical protein